jgi:very-short-patch-repair endonuclease
MCANRRRKQTGVPAPLSLGEETFAFHCRVQGLPDPMREVELIPGRAWRFDFYWPSHDLAVEIEGGTAFGKSRHSRGEGFERDARKYNSASLAGIRLLRFSTAMVESGEAINTVMGVLGYGSQCARENKQRA